MPKKQKKCISTTLLYECVGFQTGLQSISWKLKAESPEKICEILKKYYILAELWQEN